MIAAVHTMIYSADPPATRAFFRDVLELPFVVEGDDWLIFATGPSELGVHPGIPAEGDGHQICFMCDDIHLTIAELTSKGATFIGEVREASYGRVAMVDVPGSRPMVIYEPHHELAYGLDD